MPKASPPNSPSCAPRVCPRAETSGQGRRTLLRDVAPVPTADRAENMDQTDFAPTKDGSASISAEQLRTFVDRIERLEQDKAGIADDIKDCYAEAKSLGYDVKILRKVIALRKRKPSERREEEELLEVYLHALGELV